MQNYSILISFFQLKSIDRVHSVTECKKTEDIIQSQINNLKKQIKIQNEEISKLKMANKEIRKLKMENTELLKQKEAYKKKIHEKRFRV